MSPTRTPYTSVCVPALLLISMSAPTLRVVVPVLEFESKKCPARCHVVVPGAELALSALIPVAAEVAVENVASELTPTIVCPVVPDAETLTLKFPARPVEAAVKPVPKIAVLCKLFAFVYPCAPA